MKIISIWNPNFGYRVQASAERACSWSFIALCPWGTTSFCGGLIEFTSANVKLQFSDD